MTKYFGVDVRDFELIEIALKYELIFSSLHFSHKGRNILTLTVISKRDNNIESFEEH